MPGADEILLIEKKPPVAWLKLNRPQAANALNVALLNALFSACTNLAADPAIHAVAIIGSGSKAFCAGADLSERKDMKPLDVIDYHALIQKTFLAIEKLPQPVIAALNGSSYGGGTELALVCDLRVMVAQASMRLTEVRLGIIPGAGGTQRLPRLIGKSRAKEMIYFASPVTAEQARDWGLVHQVVDAPCKDSEPFNQALIDKVNGWIEEMLNAAPLSLRQAKLAIDEGCERDLVSGLALESKAYMRLLNTKDRTEALVAFAEKRKPVFRGE